MDDESLQQGLDPDRARLIGSIYEVVLRPEHFDSFMSDWSEFVDKAARRLGELQVTEGQASRRLEDPVIEAHFRRAFSLFERMGRGENVLAPGIGDSAALVRLGRGGSVLSVSAGAAALFDTPVNVASISAALEPESARRLAAFLAAFDRAPASGRFAVLSLGEAQVAGRAGAMPGGGLVSAVTLRDEAGDGLVIELRPMTIGWTEVLSQVLAQSFRLTPRECDLVRELARGGDIATIAERSGRSLNTLKAQLKSVFAKTRTVTQSDLMRLVAVLMLHGPDSAAQAEAVPVQGHEHRIDLGDGRRMPVQVLGPEDGVPVVFVHGMLEGLGSLGRVGPVLAAAGVRLVAPMRANFGAAYPDPRVREGPDLFARDLGQVLDALGIGRAVVMGHMAGTIPAFAAAARLGPRIAGVANVAGAVPVRSIEQFATMTPRQRAIALTARFAPALLPAVLRAGMAKIDSRDAEGFMTPLYAEGSRDRAVIDRHGISEALIEGYRYTVAQGTRAFQIDAWHVTRDWSALVAGSSCPVRLIHGALDPVISVASVRAFVERTPRASLREFGGEGQLLLYARPEAVMAEIAAFGRAALAAN